MALSPNLEGPQGEVSQKILNSIQSNFLESLQPPKCNPDKVNTLHWQLQREEGVTTHAVDKTILPELELGTWTWLL